MNSKPHTLVFAAVVLSIAGAQEPAVPPEVPDEDRYGVLKGDPVETGIFVLDGAIVPRPYRVDRSGLKVVINDTIVVTESREPAEPEPMEEPSIDPQLVATATSEDDLKVTYKGQELPYISMMIFYINLQSRDQEQVTSQVIEFYQSFPFVESVEPESPNSRLLSVERTDGKVYLSEAFFDIDEPEKIEDIIQSLDFERDTLEANLRRGKCVFQFTNASGSSIPREWTQEFLGDIDQAVSEGLSGDEAIARFKEKRPWTYAVTGEEALWPLFLTNFQLNDELRAEIDAYPAQSSSPFEED